jgi:hypothetical protein
VDSYANTTAHKLMHDVLARGGVIGGSSSGASIQADYMARGHPVSNRQIMAEGYERGLGFLTGTAIDQHITQRNRLPELRSLKNTYPQLLGIGLDEGAALLVRNSVAEVHALPGRQAFFFDLHGGAEEDDHTFLYSGQTYDMGLRLPRQEPAEPLPAPNDIVGTWKLEWTVSSNKRTATLRLGLDLQGTVVFDEERYPVRDLRLEGDSISFELDGFAGFPLYRATRTGGILRGSLSAEGIHVAEFQGTKLDDGPSEYFDDARPARGR